MFPGSVAQFALELDIDFFIATPQTEKNSSALPISSTFIHAWIQGALKKHCHFKVMSRLLRLTAISDFWGQSPGHLYYLTPFSKDLRLDSTTFNCHYLSKNWQLIVDVLPLGEIGRRSWPARCSPYIWTFWVIICPSQVATSEEFSICFASFHICLMKIYCRVSSRRQTPTKRGNTQP